MENLLLEEAVSLAKRQSRGIVESGEEHIPLLIIITPKGLVLTRPVVIKSAFRLVLSKLLVMLNASAYVMVREAWSAKFDRDSPLAEKLSSGALTVSELPLDDREKILTITAVDNGRSYCCWIAKINYDRDNRHLKEWKEMPRDGEVSGRMVLKEW